MAGSSSNEYLRNAKYRVNVNSVYYNIDLFLTKGVSFQVIFTGMSVKEIRNFKMNLKDALGEEATRIAFENASSLEVDISQVETGLSSS